MSDEQKKELTDLTVEQKKLYTRVTIDDQRFMVWKNCENDPCVRPNIGSYTEFAFIEKDIDGMIKFLEWYKQHKNEVKVIEPPKKRYDKDDF